MCKSSVILDTDYRRCSEFGYEQIDGINGYCFKNYGVKKAYSEAQNTCRNDGGHLVRISTSTKHGHIQSFMKLKSSMYQHYFVIIFRHKTVFPFNVRILDYFFNIFVN